jgi:hypothetical protein
LGVTLRSSPWAAALALAALLVGPPARSTPKARPRGVNPRTGRQTPPVSALVKAYKKNDRATLERLASRFGVAGLAAAVRGTDAAVAEAALATIPFARGGVLLVGVVAERLDASDPVGVVATQTLGALLSGDSPAELTDWEVPPDVVARACAGLRSLATRTAAPMPARLAALDALATAQLTCPAPSELGALLRDPAPAVKRAAALVVREPDSAARQALADGITNPDPAVSGACVATVCRRVEPPARGKAPVRDALVEQATGAARSMVVVAATKPEDAVDMLSCVAAAGTPADRSLLEKLRAGPPSPVRDRAALLLAAGGKPE